MGEVVAWDVEELKARKQPVSRADSPPSAARCVGQFFGLKRNENIKGAFALKCIVAIIL